MREEELKLERVKKSCKITKRVAKVIEGIVIACAAICAVCAIVCFCLRGRIDSEVAAQMSQFPAEAQEIENELLHADEIEIGGLLSLSVNTAKLVRNGEYGLLCVTYCLIGAIACALISVVFDLLRRIFKTIEVSETPFDEAVIKKIRVLFIVITGAILLLSGIGEAALTGLICWSIYNILDYGFTLQKEFDETL